MRGMYRYCCGSIPNRGGIDAKAYVETAIHDGKMRYCAKLDISKFFDSVRPSVLLDMWKRKIKDPRMLELIGKILENGGDHLPIGYYTSQWFSNFYLEGLDHYVKEQLHIKYYVRYVDDMVLIDSNKRKLRRAVAAINEYLHGIGLKLKDNWQVWRLNSRPIDFVGYRFYKGFTLLRKHVFYSLTRVVRKIKRFGVRLRQCVRFISYMSRAKVTNFKKYYIERIKPIISKGKAQKIVSYHARTIAAACG